MQVAASERRHSLYSFFHLKQVNSTSDISIYFNWINDLRMYSYNILTSDLFSVEDMRMRLKYKRYYLYKLTE